MEPADGPEPLAARVTPREMESVTKDADARYPARDPELPMLYCPVCSQRLASRKCKLFCERCGYYMSCADYY